MGEGEQIRELMLQQLLPLKAKLDSLKLQDQVLVNFNEVLWKAIIFQIEPHKFTLPNFRVRLPESGQKTLYWVSGTQIVFEDPKNVT